MHHSHYFYFIVGALSIPQVLHILLQIVGQEFVHGVWLNECGAQLANRVLLQRQGLHHERVLLPIDDGLGFGSVFLPGLTVMEYVLFDC